MEFKYLQASIVSPPKTCRVRTGDLHLYDAKRRCNGSRLPSLAKIACLQTLFNFSILLHLSFKQALQRSFLSRPRYVKEVLVSL